MDDNRLHWSELERTGALSGLEAARLSSQFASIEDLYHALQCPELAPIALALLEQRLESRELALAAALEDLISPGRAAQIRSYAQGEPPFLGLVPENGGKPGD